MEVNWRGAEYEFNPRVIEGGGDNYTKFSNIDGLIFGADTESVQLEDRYEVQCFTFSSEEGDHLLYVQENAFVFKKFMEWFLTEYEEALFSHHIPHHLMYFHNLEYDWLQMIKTDERLLEIARIGVSPSNDIDLFTVSGFKVTMKKNSLFVGSAPHVRLRISKGRQAFTLYIYDTFSFFPSSLSKLAKDLDLEVDKMERQEDLGKIDYRHMKECKEKEYFEKYSKVDAKVTRLAGEKIRELHRQANMTKIRPSSPAYAINLLYHMMDDTQSIQTGNHDPSIMQLILDTYRGGRTGGIYHGKVEGVSVLDFHSSYPASMLSLPSFSPNMAYVRLDDLELENVLPILEETGNAFLLISGEETDPYYPSLLTTVNGKLTPVYGEFDRISTTGYEFMVGLKSGGLKNIVLHDVVVCLDMDNDPYLPFKEFASKSYERKNNSIKGSVEYASAKLALNSAYGKLIESRTQTLIGSTHSRDYLPYIEGMEKEFGNYYYTRYEKALETGLDWDGLYNSILEELTTNFTEDDLEGMNNKMFGDFSISGRIYGRYVVPAGASLITGCSRARLLSAMKSLGAYYWDTDSVFIPHRSEDEVNELLKVTGEWLPKGTVSVQVGEELGELDFEMINGSGYLAGVKRYYLEDSEDNIKSATHGIPALPKQQTKEIIASLAAGKSFEYESKPRPQKAKESKRIEDIGSFKSKRYNSEFHLDDRLMWEKINNGWVGKVKDYYSQGFPELDQETKEEYKKQLEGVGIE